jgi:hypothetical protein
MGDMVKRGRPFTYQREDEKPVTVSLRIPRDLYDRMSRYTARHRQSVTELLLDGITWRLEQEDHRGRSIQSIEYYDNTVLQELIKPLHLLDEAIPFDEDLAAFPEIKAQPVPDKSNYDNTVIQEKADSRLLGRPSTKREPILSLLRSHPEGLTAEQIRGLLSPEKPIGDTLQGMRRSNLVRTEGIGREMRYFLAEKGEGQA